MAKRDYYMIVDTETTMKSKVADFSAVIVDRKGKIHKECAVLVDGIYNDMEDTLFHKSDLEGTIFSPNRLAERYAAYNAMLESGSRMLASINAINRWLARALDSYNPILTAYNVAFDLDKAEKSGIDLGMFQSKFCLWYAAAHKFGHTKQYRQYCLENHAFGNVTELGNLTYKTNAETMARFIVGPELPSEPHTSYEDVIGYELPILIRLLKRTSKKELFNYVPYDWNKYQVRDWFEVK